MNNKCGGFQSVNNAWRADIPPPKRETAHDVAADYLRRFMPVSRCNIKGRYCETGDHFRVGASILTFAETIARAEKMKMKMETRK